MADGALPTDDETEASEGPVGLEAGPVSEMSCVEISAGAAGSAVSTDEEPGPVHVAAKNADTKIIS